MTDEDKKIVAGYMGWNPYPPECMGETVFYRDETHGDIRWDMNAVAICLDGKGYEECCKMIAEFYGWGIDE